MADFEKLISSRTAKIDALKARSEALKAEAKSILDSAEADSKRALTEAEDKRSLDIVGELQEIRGQVEPLESEVAAFKREQAEDEKVQRDAEKATPTGLSMPARTNPTAATYNERNQGEFMKDLYAFSFGSLRPEQSERLLKHEQEARATGRFSERAASTSTFAGIIPPQYLVDQYALVARQGRPTANVVQHFDLPATGMSLIIPRGTTGVSIGVQATENSALSTTDQVWSNVTVPVVTIGAYNDVSRQSVDRAEGIDQIVFNDLAAAYAVAVDQQVLSGTGSGGQALGILATSGVNQASAFGAAATVATFYSKVAGQINAVQTSRFMAPNVIIMHPRRWNWLMAQVDSSNRPLAVPNQNGPFNAVALAESPDDVAKTNPQGFIQGVPVITDASVPTSVGTGPEDQVIVARKEDLMLWEDPSAPFTLRFEQTVGTNLTIRLVAYGYAAFTAGRFPTAVGIVGGNAAVGNGLVAPTF